MVTDASRLPIKAASGCVAPAARAIAAPAEKASPAPVESIGPSRDRGTWPREARVRTPRASAVTKDRPPTKVANHRPPRPAVSSGTLGAGQRFRYTCNFKLVALSVMLRVAADPAARSAQNSVCGYAGAFG